MKYGVDDVITLDDGKEYYLMDKNVIDGVTYYYAVEYKGNVEDMIGNEFCFFEEDNGDLVDVIDEEMITKLIDLFIKKATN